jgi:hypothetical protein
MRQPAKREITRRKEGTKIRGTFSRVIHLIVNCSSSLALCWRIFMQRFYGKIFRHGSKAISVSPACPKSTRTELNQARGLWQDAGARLVTAPIIKTLASAVRRRGSRSHDGPELLSKNPVQLGAREFRTTLRIDWCLGEVRPIPIRVEKNSGNFNKAKKRFSNDQAPTAVPDFAPPKRMMDSSYRSTLVLQASQSKSARSFVGMGEGSGAASGLAGRFVLG